MQRLQTRRLINNPPNLLDQCIKEVVKAGDCTPIWARGMAYRYCNIGGEIELNISLRGINGDKTHFRAVLHRTSKPVHFNGTSQRVSSDFYLPIGNAEQCEIECPVLVGIVEFIENPEQGRLAWVESIVRLRRFDPAYDLSTNTFKSSGTLPFKFLRVRGDGKVELVEVEGRGNATFLDSDGVKNIIKGRPQIVDAVPGDEGPSIERRRSCKVDDYGMAGAVSVLLCSDGIRVAPSPFGEFRLEEVEVLFRATEFE